ncbi:MAG: hypothetical protein PHU03_00220 [Syntrophales bacterium]|nr:hypothetical protein [Syntrophales bacterium]
MELNITNHATDVPFSFILQELLIGNIEKSEAKYEIYKKTRGITAIEVPDIETAISLHFQGGSLTIESGVNPYAAIIISTSSDNIMALSSLSIRLGLPHYFDEAGRRVLGLLFTGKIKIKGLLKHPLLLTRLTVIMSVM